MFTYFLETHYARVEGEVDIKDPLQERKAKAPDFEGKYEISQLQNQRTQAFLKTLLAKYNELESKDSGRSLNKL